MLVSARAGEVLRETFASPALGRDGQYTVYLPEGYAAATAPYPVVYLLHGAGGDEWDWLRHGNLVATLDGLITRGALRPSVVVMPTVGPVSWWVNGPALAAEDADSGWFLRSMLDQIKTWAAVPEAEFTLAYRGANHTVIWRHQDTAVDASPVVFYNDVQSSDFYRATLRFLEV